MNAFLNALLILSVIGLVWSFLVFNRLVRLRQHVRESWAGIDVQLKRRHDLIPNLVATVRGYAAHESAILDNITRLRAAAAGAASTARAASAAETPLAAALGALFVTVEAYPALKADAQFLALQRELAETEDRIAAARRFFNANIRDYNSLCEQFPSLLIARAAGFQPYSFFELSDAAERVVPRVGL